MGPWSPGQNTQLSLLLFIINHEPLLKKQKEQGAPDYFPPLLAISLKAQAINSGIDNDDAIWLLPYQQRKLSLSLDPRLLLFL